jgi:hypothetical protein
MAPESTQKQTWVCALVSSSGALNVMFMSGNLAIEFAMSLGVFPSRRDVFYAYHMSMNYAEWRNERAKCESCRHSLVENDPQQPTPGTILRCEMFGNARVSSRWRMFAIYAREDDKCGKEARLWEPKT